MKYRRFPLFATLAVGLGLSASATDHTWANKSGGVWSTPENWSPQSVPASGDNAVFSSATSGTGLYTITLEDDRSANAINIPDGAVENGLVLDLGGHALTLSSWVFALSFNLDDWATPASQGDINYRGIGLCVKNGTLTAGGMRVGQVYGQSWGYGMLDLSNVALTSKIAYWGGKSRMLIRDGSVWTVTGASDLQPSSWVSGNYASVVVTGATSRIDSADYGIYVRNQYASLCVLDGATATFKTVCVGDNYRANYGLCRVDNSTLSVSGRISLGTAETDPSTGLATAKGNSLEIRGRAARVVANELRIYEETLSTVRFDVPKAGFDATPLALTNAIDFVARAEGQESLGATTLKIACYEWAMTHSEASCTLIALETADAEGLASLASRVSWVDISSALRERGFVPTLSVSADGKALVLTAPAADPGPVFSVTSSKGSATGRKKLTAKVTDYGYGASSVVSARLSYADNEEMTGATTVDLTMSALSGTLPQSVTFDVDGGFKQHVPYWGRLTLVNDLDGEWTATVTFTGDAIAETYTWASAVDGSWTDASKWTGVTDGDASVRWPHAEDTVTWASGAYTVTADRDIACYKMSTFSAGGPLTFDLAGHTLNVTYTSRDPFKAGQHVWWSWDWKSDIPIGSKIVVKNGAFLFAKDSFIFDTGGENYVYNTSSCTLDNGSEMYVNLRLLVNSFRLFVKNGSVLNANYELVMCSTYAGDGHQRILVSGEGSKIDLGTCRLLVRGPDSQCRFWDGAHLKAGNLGVGSSWWSGAASTYTLCSFTNATAALSGGIEIGWTNNYKCTPRFVLAGTNAQITAAGTLKIHDKIDATVEFALPTDGFKACPLSVADLAFVELPEGNTDFGATKLKLTGLEGWMRAHPGATQPLLTLTTANAAALERLRAAATFDWKRATASNLAVSDDGTQLLLKAPSRKGVVIVIR